MSILCETSEILNNNKTQWSHARQSPLPDLQSRPISLSSASWPSTGVKH